MAFCFLFSNAFIHVYKFRIEIKVAHDTTRMTCKSNNVKLKIKLQIKIVRLRAILS